MTASDTTTTRCPYRHPTDDGLCQSTLTHDGDHYYRDAFGREFRWARDREREVLTPIAELRAHCVTRAARTMAPKRGAWERRAAALDVLLKLANAPDSGPSGDRLSQIPLHAAAEPAERRASE